MNVNVKATLTLLSLAGVLAGCRTTKDVLNDYERDLSTGNYLSLPIETHELAEKHDGSELVWRLLAGYGNYLTCHGSDAIGEFDKAEDVFLANDRTSVFEQSSDVAFALLANDKTLPYGGGGQDRIFTCFYKAVDYASSGNRDAARTELNRAAQHQENWIYERRRDVEAAARRLKQDADAYEKKETVDAAQAQQTESDRDRQVNGALADAAFSSQIKAKCGFDPATSGNLDALAPKDYMNLYVHHACGVFRWLLGDNGRNYFKDVYTIQPDNVVAARDFREADSGVRPQNQVWVYVEDGLCPVREEWRLDLPLLLLPGAGRYVMYAGMALPYLRERPPAANAWSVSANGVSANFSTLADVDKLTKTEFDVYMRGALTREITRTIVKAGVQVALGICAEKSGDWRVQTALKLSQAGAAAWAATTVGADIRSWTALPKRVFVCRIDRPADGVITVMADGVPFQFNVPEGNSMAFVRKASSVALPVVKTISF